MATLKFQMKRIHAEGEQDQGGPIPTDMKEFEELPTTQCSADLCPNSTNLRKCKRCKSAFYCSVECQRNDWKHHKEQCNMNATVLQASTDDNEPPIRRHLRHWTSRFDVSLICAAIVGMDIHRSFSNVDKYGMIVHLSPRPHDIVGARFSLKACVIVPMKEFTEFLDDYRMGLVLLQHKKERESLRAKSGGERDFAACLVVAINDGQWKLPGEHNVEARFKPLCVDRAMARSPQLNDPTLDWLTTLTMQIQKDLPSRRTV